MKNNNLININWELEIPDSHLCKGGGIGAFWVSEVGELILSYNQNRNYIFHKWGKLVRINQPKIKIIYKTKQRLWAPVLSEGNIYMMAQSLNRGINTSRGVLSKFNSKDTLEWQFKMDGAADSLPVICHDSIFFTDFKHNRGPKFKRNLYRLSKQGEVLLKMPIQDSRTFEPWVMQGKQRIILKYVPDRLDVFDFDGNKVMTKKIKGLLSVLFVEGKNQRLFVATENSILAIDDDLNTLWEYQPFKGLAGDMVVFDSVGNLYGIFQPYLLKSLDQNGNERWQYKVKGYGYQPYILENNLVLIATSGPSGKKEGQETSSTWLELFSSTGSKQADLELPGYIYHCASIKPGEVIVATNCTRNNAMEEIQIDSIKIFSVNLEI